MLPDGPKVFKGGRTTPHRLSDFEDVRRTKLVGEKIEEWVAVASR